MVHGACLGRSIEITATGTNRAGDTIPEASLTRVSRAACVDEGASCDDFFSGVLRCAQPRDGLRSGIDTILLAAAVRAQGGDSVLEVGAGAGVGTLALAARVAGISLDAVEVETELTQMLADNIELNAELLSRRGCRVRALHCDWLGGGAWAQQYDHVFSNPPYDLAGEVRISPERLKAGAKVISRQNLVKWLTRMVRRTRSHGTVSVIHKPAHLGLILEAFAGKLGAVRVTPLVSRRGQDAYRVLVSGVVASRAPLVLRPELVIHEADGSYCGEIEELLRHPAALKS